MKAFPGIWTPAADVLCLTCHGPMLKFGREDKPTGGFENREDATEQKSYFKCDGCGRPTHCNYEDGTVSDVTQLAELRDKLRDVGLIGVEMSQTGGMCAALSFGLYQIYASESLDPLFGIVECQDVEHLDYVDAIDGDVTAEKIVEFLLSKFN